MLNRKLTRNLAHSQKEKPSSSTSFIHLFEADNGGISVEFSHQGKSRRVELSALVESLGYEKTPVSDFITDVDMKTGRASAFDRPIYLSGWALGGAKGVVGDSTESSRLAVQSLFDDIDSGSLQALPRPDIGSLPHSNWDNWRKIDEEELRRGQENGKTRDKILSISEMIKITE